MYIYILYIGNCGYGEEKATSETRRKKIVGTVQREKQIVRARARQRSSFSFQG